MIDDQTGFVTPDEMDAFDVLNDWLQAKGYWIFACGLTSPTAATVIDNRGTEALPADGPLLESKEYISGLWVVTAPDLETARALAEAGSNVRNRKVELRPLLGG